MKKRIPQFCLLCIGFVANLAFATNVNELQHLSLYQELCAKEQDPIKRHQYCQILNQLDLSNPRYEMIRQDIALG